MTSFENIGVTDGPWRVADHIRVLASGGSDDEAADAAAMAALAAETAGIGVVAHGAATAQELSNAWLTREGRVVDLLVMEVGSKVEASALSALRRVADSDPMLVAAMPRFGSAAAAWLAFPDVTYTTLPDLRCLYVKGSILAAFAGSMRDGGPKAIVDDLATSLLLLNRFGFRVAIANRANVFRRSEDGLQLSASHAALPADFHSALSQHLSSAPVRAERIMRGLDPGSSGRRAVAFDLTHVAARHSGTSELARALVGRAASQWHEAETYVIATASAFAFHFGENHSRLRRVDPEDARCFAVLIRIGQPFLWAEMESAVLRAPVLVFFMLDTIGFDCLTHAPDELDALWRFALSEADGLLFNSAFTERQFARRFAIRPGVPRRASLHSLDLADYRAPADDAETGKGSPLDRGASDASAPEPAASESIILVIGNAFSHKHLRETARLLATAGLAESIVVLGLRSGAIDGITTIPSGSLDVHRLAALFRSARLVVYPSVYEGFGFPILQALAQRRPILVRPLPPYAEIAAGLPESCNIHYFEDDAALLGLLRQEIRWIETARSVPPRNWDDATSDLREIVATAVEGVSYDRVLRRIDLMRGRMAYMRSRTLGSTEGSDDLDRLATAVGRSAKRLVMQVGHRVPGAAAVLRFAGRALRPRRKS